MKEIFIGCLIFVAVYGGLSLVSLMGQFSIQYKIDHVMQYIVEDNVITKEQFEKIKVYMKREGL